jgi:hypothetical protein
LLKKATLIIAPPNLQHDPNLNGSCHTWYFESRQTPRVKSIPLHLCHVLELFWLLLLFYLQLPIPLPIPMKRSHKAADLTLPLLARTAMRAVAADNATDTIGKHASVGG